jgi:hypothetical protein
MRGFVLPVNLGVLDATNVNYAVSMRLAQVITLGSHLGQHFGEVRLVTLCCRKLRL